ncbi:hypothetical protein [Sinomicrobium sp. M5D2P9]
MSGGGSIQGMINSLKNNKKLLRSKSLFSKEKTFLNIKKEYLKAAGGNLDFKKASKEDITRIRKSVLKERKKDNIILGPVNTTRKDGFLSIFFVYRGMFDEFGSAK